MQRIDKDELRRAGHLVMAVHATAALRVAQGDPIGRAIARAHEAVAVDAGFQ